MKNSMKKLLHVLLILLVGFIGGTLGVVTMQKFGTSSTVANSTTTTSTKNGTTTSNVTYNNTTSVSEAVDKVKNAVVSVINYQTSNNNSRNPYSIFGDNNNSGELAVAGEGSGVIYKKEGNSAYLVTNTHVVAGAEQIEIKLADGNTVKGTLVGSDTYSDISVVKIDASVVTTVAEFGNSDSLNVGEIAIAIGSPLGTEYANSVTQGIVSSLSRTVTSKAEDGQTISTNAIQTDAAINPGNSGGPLINIQGQVIGITSSKITSSSASLSSSVSVEGMGFAIPANDAVSIIAQLEKNGKVERPALGIQMASLSNLSATDIARLNVPKDLTAGIVVVSVHSGLSADGRLKAYDIITKIDGKTIESSSDLQSALYSKNIGDTITVTFYRDGKEQTTDIQLSSSTDDLQ
ncbi:S1C family serine protease [Streptococcus merionis]|uniref:S1C family serine protease n=1 Tax=Streptococcus merionis TaxID=400065 RepID=UPI0026EAAF14|nr:trypsin-like peptidase domain-containing protein [Streptococcus merionis]